jgi:hypothetical protein
MSNQPIHFEPNLGQASKGARFVARNAQYVLELWDEGLTLTFPIGPEVEATAEIPEVCLLLKDRSKEMHLVPERRLPTLAAYYGDDRTKWRTHIPTYNAVRYQGAWCGIDWLIQGSGKLVEHEFVLAPHAQLSQVRFAIVGADQVRLTAAGSLVLEAGGYEFSLRAPVGYQLSAKDRQPVGARFVLDATRREVGFAITSYPMDQLVIDPVLLFATSFGTLESVERLRPADQKAA